MATTNQAQGHKFFSRKHFAKTFRPFYTNKRMALVAIVLFALIGVIATYVTNAAQIVNEETVILSSGVPIRLDEDINTVKRILGSKLYQVNATQYIVRRKANDPIEVVMETDASQKIAIIHLTGLPTNYMASTGLRVGMNIPQLRAQFPSSHLLPRGIAHPLTIGAVLDQTRSSQYFFAPPCIRISPSHSNVSLVSLVRRGREDLLKKYLGAPTCLDQN